MRSAAFLILLACAAAAQVSTPEQLFREAVEAQRRGDDASAVRKYEELIRLRPDVVEVRANLGAALAHLGRFDEAIAQYRAALTRVPGNTGLRLNLALAYYKKGDMPEAARELKSLHEADPGDVRIATLLGECDARQGHDTEAIAVLAPLEVAHPGDLDLAWALGQALIRAGRLADGLVRVEKVAEGRGSAEAWLLAGDTALRLNFFERAQKDADAAMRINPRLPGLYTLQGKVLQVLGDNQGAIAALRKAVEADANDFEAHLNLGAVLNVERDLDGAKLHVERALQLRPSSPLARFEMARIERALGQLDAAVRDMETVERDNPGWLQLHVELAALYYRVRRPEDGAKERAIVDRLTAEQQEKDAGTPGAPAPSR
ncbi:MAG: tetratricopeptide repeat protein [Bryobacteraceae bacterium]|jgi:tetratricopeptide (TPR) repeat protein